MTLPDQSRRRGQLPLRMGGMGLASAVAHRQAAYWVSWADTVGALQAHHPDELLRHFLGREVQARPPSVEAAEQALRMQGCRVPTWESLLREGASPPPSEGEGAEDTSRRGWQKLAGAAVDKHALEMLFADLDNASRALLLSQSGEGASCVLTTVPSCPEFDVPNDEYRLVLLRGSGYHCPSPCGGVAAAGVWTP